MSSIVRRGPVRVPYSAGYASYLASLSPTAYWRLGDASGTTAVAAVGANGVYHGALTLGATGLLTGDADTAISFDGASGKYVQAGTALDPGVNDSPWTMLSWFKWGGASTGATDSNYHCIMAGWLGDATFPRLRVKSDGTTVAIDTRQSDGVTQVASTALAQPCADGQPHMIGARFGSGALDIFVDGVRVKTAAATSMGHGTTKWIIGSLTTSTNNWNAVGTIDEVAIWFSALTNDQIRRLYSIGKGLG